ncbi:hypothetical protein [Pseudonocardia sp.]|uniref:hypothetical protein n=1 Tax=Pseudonocardia sp. TaxID=60912 RepID=UPI003D09D6D5
MTPAELLNRIIAGSMMTARPAEPDHRRGLRVVQPDECTQFRSILDADPGTGRYPTALRPAAGTVRGVVTDPREVARICARCEYAALPWWRRWTTARPAGWSS